MFRQSLIKENLRLRARIIQAIRMFFIDRDYLEVETPYRIPGPAPEYHIDAIPSGPWFLHTSPELCMKQLLAAGFPRIFQICKCFRGAERGARHLPEFTMIEWYCAGADYFDLMDECEALIRFTARDTGLGDTFVYQGQTICLKGPWNRISVMQAYEAHASVSIDKALSEDRFDEVIAFEIEPKLGKQPIFLYDYPASCGALARLKPDNPSLAERFELYIGGLELCNAFTELTDQKEQRVRFEQTENDRRRAGKAPYPVPEKFLQSLKSMPGAAGNALGIDRLVMLLTDSALIDEVTAFTPEEL